MLGPAPAGAVRLFLCRRQSRVRPPLPSGRRVRPVPWAGGSVQGGRSDGAGSTAEPERAERPGRTLDSLARALLAPDPSEGLPPPAALLAPCTACPAGRGRAGAAVAAADPAGGRPPWLPRLDERACSEQRLPARLMTTPQATASGAGSVPSARGRGHDLCRGAEATIGPRSRIAALITARSRGMAQQAAVRWCCVAQADGRAADLGAFGPSRRGPRRPLRCRRSRGRTAARRSRTCAPSARSCHACIRSSSRSCPPRRSRTESALRCMAARRSAPAARSRAIASTVALRPLMSSRISMSSSRCVRPASSPAAATSGGAIASRAGEGEVPRSRTRRAGSARWRVRPTSRGRPAAAGRTGAGVRATV